MAPPETPLPVWRQRLRAAFPWLAMLFLATVVVQVFLAGVGVMTDDGWEAHTTFVHVVEVVPLAMWAAAGFGRLGRFATWGSLTAFLLVEIQYPLIMVRSAVPLVAAFHLVNALLIFGLALLLSHRNSPFPRRTRGASPG